MNEHNKLKEIELHLQTYKGHHQNMLNSLKKRDFKKAKTMLGFVQGQCIEIENILESLIKEHPKD